MDIPIKFGSISPVGSEKRLKTDITLFDTFGLLVSFVYFQLTK
jgi:hypothetical protein